MTTTTTITTTTAGKSALPEAILFPRPSRRLAAVMDIIRYRLIPGPTYRDDDQFTEKMPVPELIAEAKALLQSFEKLLAPPSSDVVRAWLRPLAAAVANSPTKADFAAKAAAFEMVSCDLHLCAFSNATLREAMGQFKFWPSIAELKEFLLSRSHKFSCARRDLVLIANVRPLEELEDARTAYSATLSPDASGIFPSERGVSQISGGF